MGGPGNLLSTLARSRLSNHGGICKYNRLISQSHFSRPCRASAFHAPLRQFIHHSSSQKRLNELHDNSEEVFPRVFYPSNAISCQSFLEKFHALPKDGSVTESNHVVLQGRISSIRRAGKRLIFVDVVQDGHKVQVLCNLSQLESSGLDETTFTKLSRKLRRGDHLSAQGLPYRTSSGQLSLLLNTLPRLVSPCLAEVPSKLEDQETRIQFRHVDMLVHPRTIGLIRLKSEVVNFMRSFLLADGHTEVQTPILAGTAGGAAARPFITSATEFSERKIALRIAPELWLKRLVIGGLDRVFEIGQSFRNEGIDSSHNPEFTTCEFYKSFVGLDNLMRMTEEMLSGIFSHLSNIHPVKSGAISLSTVEFKGPYGQIDFTEQLEACMGRHLPDLQHPDVLTELEKLFMDLDIALPELASVPQLLDRLSAQFLEPHCHEPTFIVNHPECLAPLAKSYRHPRTGHMVSARAELFVKGQEITNMYEEENSPVEQRRKFEDQLRYGRNNDTSQIDESYLEALEWGLPPTGGWGGGVERLCMALTDNNRISDFLSFGTLRNVVALGTASKKI